MENEVVISQDEYIYTAAQAGNEPTSLNALQGALAPYVDLITVILWGVWLTTFVVVLLKLSRLSFSNNSSAGSQ